MRVSIKAYAKINLTLELLGCRPDGYQEISSIMQTVSLYDTVNLIPANKIELNCDIPIKDNLALQAAKILSNKTDSNLGAKINIYKNIPESSGLGGGSSNAAAVLIGLNKLWNLKLDQNELSELGSKIGSDIPFFIHGGTGIASGRGTTVQPLPAPKLNSIIILFPNIHLKDKTSTMYSLINDEQITDGIITKNMEQKINSKSTLSPDLMFNGFDSLIGKAYPQLSRYWDMFLEQGVKTIHLAGSGPSLYATIDSKNQASLIAKTIRTKYGCSTYLVEPSIPEWI